MRARKLHYLAKRHVNKGNILAVKCSSEERTDVS